MEYEEENIIGDEEKHSCQLLKRDQQERIKTMLANAIHVQFKELSSNFE